MYAQELALLSLVRRGEAHKKVDRLGKTIYKLECEPLGADTEGGATNQDTTNGNTDAMSRDPRYQKLLNSKRWQEVKAIVWRRAEGLCERCKAEGRLTPGVDCHHIVPVEGAKTIEGPDGMEARCYNPNNCQLLCVPCHIKVHQEMRSHTKAEVKANRQRAFERWIEHLGGKSPTD